MIGMLWALYQYRVFVLTSIRTNVVTRFARSSLGGLWVILNPLAQVGIYALILSRVLQSKMEGINNPYSYAIYLTAGIMAWNLFADILGQSTVLFVNNGNMMKKVKFPKVVLPAICVGTALVDNIMLFVAGIGIMAILGHFPTVYLLYLPLITITIVALALGFGLILGVINVFIRDIAQVVPIVLQIMFWFTPIVYPIKIIPESYRQLLMLNPMFPLVESYHQIIIQHQPPNFLHIAVIAGGSLVLLAFGLFFFRRASEEMVDAL